MNWLFRDDKAGLKAVLTMAIIIILIVVLALILITYGVI